VVLGDLRTATEHPEHNSRSELKVRRLPACVSDGMLCPEILSLKVEAKMLAEINLSSATNGVGHLYFTSSHGRAIAHQICAGPIGANQPFNERAKAASGRNRNAWANQH
jgi:hypothetical protein